MRGTTAARACRRRLPNCAGGLGLQGGSRAVGSSAGSSRGAAGTGSRRHVRRHAPSRRRVGLPLPLSPLPLPFPLRYRRSVARLPGRRLRGAAPRWSARRGVGDGSSVGASVVGSAVGSGGGVYLGRGWRWAGGSSPPACPWSPPTCSRARSGRGTGCRSSLGPDATEPGQRLLAAVVAGLEHVHERRQLRHVAAEVRRLQRRRRAGLAGRRTAEGVPTVRAAPSWSMTACIA